jgi:hypothetical protein
MQNSWCRSGILSKLISPYIFLLFLQTKSKTQVMSIFGIVLFLLIFGMAFWLLLFLLGFIVPFWITLGVFEKMRPKRIFEEAEEH